MDVPFRLKIWENQITLLHEVLLFNQPNDEKEK